MYHMYQHTPNGYSNWVNSCNSVEQNWKDNHWPGMSSFASPQYERKTTEELVWAQHLHVIMVKKGKLKSKIDKAF